MSENKRDIDTNKPFQVGGQAVIEGVMMRSPKAVATAVRRQNGEIIIKKEDFTSLTDKLKFLKLPILRGAIGLVEMLSIGVKTLNFSAEIAMQDEEKEKDSKKNEKNSKIQLTFSLVFALIIGLLIFFVLPLTAVTKIFNVEQNAASFNILAGIIRLMILLLYIYGISKIKDIKRIFQYHGAEHKTVFAFEANAPLNVESAKNYSRFHPRCGTSFLLIVALTAIIFFGIFDAVFIYLVGKMSLLIRLVTHLPLIPIIGGIAYEFIKISSKYQNTTIGKIIISPGLWLQRITTQEPDEKQLEVAIAALKSALALTNDNIGNEANKFELITTEVN